MNPAQKLLISIFVSILALHANSVFAQGNASGTEAPLSKVAITGLSQMPPVAQSTISGLLGRENPSYRVDAAPGGFRARNSAHTLDGEFTKRGVTFRSGTASWKLALSANGYGESLKPIPPTIPKSNHNRVEYEHAELTEWYVNGPQGMEQGFTLARSVGHSNGQTFNIALQLGGNLTPKLNSDKRGLELIAGGGRTVFRYTGLRASDATGRELTAWLDLRGERLLMRIDDAGAQYPVVVDPFVQVAKLLASDGGPVDLFGNSVAISADGHTVVVGAIQHDNTAGAAYVFVKPTNGWANVNQVAELTASDTTLEKSLGQAVSISGDGTTVAVGASLGPSGGDGAVYVFVEPAGGWANMTETAELTESNGHASDQLGESVAISADGSTIVGASPFADSTQGKAYVFLKPSNGWVSATENAELIASAGVGGDTLGWPVDLDGHGVAVSADGSIIVGGAPHITGFPGHGSAFVFAEPSSGWSGTVNEVAQLTASDGVNFDIFGSSVSISRDGRTIVAGSIGHPHNSMSGEPGPGAAYVFVEPPSSWTSSTENAELTASDGAPSDLFGQSVSLDAAGDTLAVGAPFNNKITGATYIYREPAGGWATTSTFNEKLIASDGQQGYEFGASTALSSDDSSVTVGEPRGNDMSGQPGAGTGAAYVLGVCAAPSLTVSLSPNSLWPPNHKLVPITATVTAQDACNPNPTITLLSITANEPLKPGDVEGATFDTDDLTFELAASRSGSGDGRIYTITYSLTDHLGNSATASATVTVAHDRGNN